MLWTLIISGTLGALCFVSFLTPNFSSQLGDILLYAEFDHSATCCAGSWARSASKTRTRFCYGEHKARSHDDSRQRCPSQSLRACRQGNRGGNQAAFWQALEDLEQLTTASGVLPDVHAGVIRQELGRLRYRFSMKVPVADNRKRGCVKGPCKR